MAANKVETAFRLPVGLTKTLQEIYYGSTSNNSSKKMSVNLHLLHELQLCQKRHLQMHSMIKT